MKALESEEQRVTPEPAWLHLEEPTPEEYRIWSCTGNNTYVTEERPSLPVWWYYFNSKDEAESYVYPSLSRPFGPNGWVWDRRDATLYDLRERMSVIRKKGNLGARIMGFRDGKWVILKQYPSEEPLP